MSKLKIEQCFYRSPRRHLARVNLFLNDKHLTTINGGGEFISECEAETETAVSTARLVAKALGCEVEETIVEMMLVEKYG